jgi:hypothetical protein
MTVCAGPNPNLRRHARINLRLISTAVAESMVNRVIGRRMTKKRQMRWSRRGAHLLVQVRLAVLEAGLQDVFGALVPPVLHAGEPGSHPRLTTPRFFHSRKFPNRRCSSKPWATPHQPMEPMALLSVGVTLVHQPWLTKWRWGKARL